MLRNAIASRRLVDTIRVKPLALIYTRFAAAASP
jgi:hypothetical protein